MKNKKRELALYVALFIFFCGIIFFTGFFTWFKTWIQRWSFIKESGIQEMRRWHFNKPPIPFFKWRKHEFRNKDEILFFLEWAKKNIDVTTDMLESQIVIANKWDYSTGKLNEILKTLNIQKTKVEEMEKQTLSWNVQNGKQFINANSWSLDTFKRTMVQIRNELNNLQKHINESKTSSK